MRCVTCGLLGPYGRFALEKLWNKCCERKNTIEVLNSNEFYSFLCFFYGILCFFYQICIKTLRKFAFVDIFFYFCHEYPPIVPVVLIKGRAKKVDTI